LITAAAWAEVPDDKCSEGIQVQDSGSEFFIQRALEENWNGSLVVFAHGFQDFEEDVEIPFDQLILGDDVNIPELIVALGFDFATNSYRKKGLAVVEGSEDILDLVDIYTTCFGQPEHVYLIGPSEGGIITALLIEKHPEVFRSGLALCGPVGDFPFQINYFGNARVTFEYFFSGLLPKISCSATQISIRAWCDMALDPTDNWSLCFEKIIAPALRDPANRKKLDQWVQVANLAYDPADYLDSVEKSAKDVLRYSMLNLEDAVETLDGFPFDNKYKWYRGSKADLWLNLFVKRCRADNDAVVEMKTNYNTSGFLQRPLITMHTLQDQQIPYVHELLYSWKTLLQGSFLTKHVNLPVNRFGHCNFTLEEALFSFALMLLYSGDLDLLAGVGTLLQGSQLDAFVQKAEEYNLPFTLNGERLNARLK
jgi:hypothetical protein